MGGWRRAMPLVAWLCALGTGLVAFHALGEGAMAPPPLTEPTAWGSWLGEREPALAAAALLRLVVLTLAWYLVGATTIGLVARLVRVAGLIRLADALTLPMVRRLLQGALGVSLATAMVGAAAAPAVRDLEVPRLLPAAEETGARAPQDAPDGSGGPLSMRLVEQDATSEDGEPPDATLPPPSADRPVHRVEAGESLWSIADSALSRRWEREPSDAEVLAYWHDVIEHNRDALADPDNPDLIFPGDEIVLPDVADRV